MPDFNLVAQPSASPTKCRFCGDFAGPMIDTRVDDPVYGRIYICAPTEQRTGCVGQIAQMCGLRSSADVDLLAAQVEDLQGRLDDLMRAKGTITLTWDEFIGLQRVLGENTAANGVGIFFDNVR